MDLKSFSVISAASRKASGSRSYTETCANEVHGARSPGSTLRQMKKADGRVSPTADRESGRTDNHVCPRIGKCNARGGSGRG